VKLRITAVVECEVEDLAHYEAATLEEAARNQQQWIDEGACTIGDIFDTEDVKITVEALP